MKPRRIQLSRQRGYRKPPGAVVCSRPGPWGNWWRLKSVDGDFHVTDTQDPHAEPTVCFFKRTAQKAAVGSFEADLDSGLCNEFLERAKSALRGKDLACWCRLCPEHRDGKPLGVECEACDPCHVDVLLTVVNE